MKWLIISLATIFILIIIVYILISLFSLSKKEKRIASFALSKKDFVNASMSDDLGVKFWTFIHKISNILSESKMFTSLGIRYERYILVKEDKYKSSIDYVSVKLLIILLSFFFGLLLMFLEIIPWNIFLLLAFLLGGLLIPELFWRIRYIKKCHEISQRLYEAIIMVDDSIKNITIYKAIKKASLELGESIGDELEKVLIDLSYSLTLSQAFKRMYERTGIEEIKNIYRMLILDAKEELTFKLVRGNLNYLNKVKEIRNSTKMSLEIIGGVALTIPLIYTFILSVIKPEKINALVNSPNGILLLFLILTLYIMLIYIFKKVVEVIK